MCVFRDGMGFRNWKQNYSNWCTVYKVVLQIQFHLVLQTLEKTVKFQDFASQLKLNLIWPTDVPHVAPTLRTSHQSTGIGKTMESTLPTPLVLPSLTMWWLWDTWCICSQCWRYVTWKVMMVAYIFAWLLMESRMPVEASTSLHVSLAIIVDTSTKCYCSINCVRYLF